MKLHCADLVLDLAEPQVMGVLNVTPDSFSDGGALSTREAAIARGLAMAEEGAAIVDVGGESTRPGAQPVPTEEEIRRVVPVIEALAARLPIPISVDTSKPEVIRAATLAGARLVNDVRALRLPGALDAAAASGAAVCLMHMRGEPGDMQLDPRYGDVVAEVRDYLAGRLAACEATGIARARLCVDPGIGFGKRLEHNLALLRGVRELVGLGVPVLVGVSRKSMIGMITGRATGERLAGGLALAALAVAAGARIVRAHDVAATADAVKVAAAWARATH